jgi:hypothetical protein
MSHYLRTAECRDVPHVRSDSYAGLVQFESLPVLSDKDGRTCLLHKELVDYYLPRLLFVISAVSTGFDPSQCWPTRTDFIPVLLPVSAQLLTISQMFDHYSFLVSNIFAHSPSLKSYAVLKYSSMFKLSCRIVTKMLYIRINKSLHKYKDKQNNTKIWKYMFMPIYITFNKILRTNVIIYNMTFAY